MNNIETGLIKLLVKRFLSKNPSQATLIRDVAGCVAGICAILAVTLGSITTPWVMALVVACKFLAPFLASIGLCSQFATTDPNLLFDETIKNVDAVVRDAQDLKKK